MVPEKPRSLTARFLGVGSCVGGPDEANGNGEQGRCCCGGVCDSCDWRHGCNWLPTAANLRGLTCKGRGVHPLAGEAPRNEASLTSAATPC